MLMLVGGEQKHDWCSPWHQLVKESHRNKLANDGSYNPGFLQQRGGFEAAWTQREAVERRRVRITCKRCALLDADKTTG